MARGLQAELKQTVPFRSREQEAYLSLLRTADALQSSVESRLKEFGLTGTQYNALRILRGAGVEGATCSQIGERLLTRDPDITRLLDRMEARGLLLRERSSEDRRVVITRISAAGLALVDSMDQPLRKLSKSKLGKFGRESLAELIAGLERMREAFET